MKKKIYIASKSALKRNALIDAVSQLGLDADIVAVAAESGVNAQPVEKDETIAGAKNRLKAIEGRLAETDCDAAVSIESGLFRELRSGGKRVWTDMAAILLSRGPGKTVLGFSDPVDVPD